MSGFSPEEFGAAFSTFLEWVNRDHVEGGEAPFSSLLTEHFGESPALYPLTAETIALYDLPNIQLALDSYLSRPGTDHRLIGFGGPIEHVELSLSGLVHDEAFGIREGPVRHAMVKLADKRSLSWVTTGLFLVSSSDTRIAAMVTQEERGFGRSGLELEVMAKEEEAGQRFIQEIRALMHEQNVYRGKVMSLSGGNFMEDEGELVAFKTVPEVERDDIVLPDGVLEMIELHTVEFARHAEELRRRGRHLRRGLLLHGPPGTGKTLCVSYVISQLTGRTVVIMTGGSLGGISEACSIAKALQPAIVVLEDVDLVAFERTMDVGATPLLFELMNQMDGIGEDSDVIFLMTTNRADLLEPALAARPGRVDQAIELPLPGEADRGRLLDLFCIGLSTELRDRSAVLKATDGASPALLRELVRKAALQAAVAGSATVTDEHFAMALETVEKGSLTRKLLGADGEMPEFGEDLDDWLEEE